MIHNLLKHIDFIFINGTHIDVVGANVKLYIMRPKTALHQLKPLLKVPSFTASEAALLGVHPSSLAHYAKRGDLERIARGVYRSPTAPTIEDFRWEDLFIAIQSVKDGVICLISALSIYGLTEEMARSHWIAVAHSTRHRADSSVKVVRMRDIKLGRTEITIGGMRLPIFDRERTIIDAFRSLSRETAIKALKFALATKKREEFIDLEKLRKYAKKLRFPIEPYILTATT